MPIPECIKNRCDIETNLPLDGAVYAPYLRVTLAGEEVLLSGNKSSPLGENPHHAMITSFQYGTQSGTGSCGCTIEVVDEGGLLYEKVYNSLNKSITSTGGDSSSCKIEFGWIIVNCDGSKQIITNETIGGSNYSSKNSLGDDAKEGGPIHVLPKKLSTNFDGGIIKFTLECSDLFSARSGDSRLESNIGSEDNKVELKTALDELFREYDPSTLTQTQFLRSDGDELDFHNTHGGSNGYSSVHNMDQETNIGCARKWLNNTKTAAGKGVLIMYDPGSAGVVFLEDPDARFSADCCDKKHNLRNYIVNGGNSSTVISFNPTFDWIFGGNSGTGGIASGGSSGDMGKKTKEADGIFDTGIQSQPIPDSNQYHWMAPDNQVFELQECFKLHNDATKSYEGMISPIQAELKIIGDPGLVNPLFLTAKWISIMVINPYYIKKSENVDGQCEWLTESSCNPILTNKRWMIAGVDHQITSGSYFTTIKVRLDAPGVDISIEEPLGGCSGAPKINELGNIRTKVRK